MSPFILLDTADGSIGLIDKSSISKQALMEFLIQGISNQREICGDEIVPCEIVKWGGVAIKDDKVTRINWDLRRLHGSLHLEWLPLTVRTLTAIYNQLTGTIDLCHLPNVTDCLTLNRNEFVGPIDLQRLPEELKILHLDRNRLNGSVELTRLPEKLQCLRLWGNRFSGSLNLTNLPPEMTALQLKSNCFSGSVDLSLLPSGLKELTLSQNELSGDVFLDAALFDEVKVEHTKLTKRILEIAPLDPKHVPRCWQTSLMDQFYASISEDGKIALSQRNPYHDYCDWMGVTCEAGVVRKIKYYYMLYGNLDVHSLSSTVESIGIDRSQQTYALHTRAFPRELQFCSLNENRLFGSVDLRTLPRKLVRLSLWDNKLTGPIALTSLPLNLEKLYMYRNQIVQSVVYYDRLPPKVNIIQIVTNKERTNLIGKVCAVHTERAVKNKEIFKPMSRKKVQ